MDNTIKMDSYEELAVVWSGVTGQEISEEYVVPDTMPDLGTILDAEGTILLRGKEAEQGCVRLTASVAACVLYAPEDGKGVRSLELTIPAELRLDAPGVNGDCRPVARMRLRSLEARAVNSRKLALRGEIETELQCFLRKELEIPAGLASEEKGVHILEKTVETMPVTDVREKTFVVTDEFPMPAGCAAVDGILSRRTDAVLDDVKYVSGKAVFRGRIISELLIKDADEVLHTGRYETEFSQIMEIGACGEDAVPRVALLLTGVFYDPPEYGREQGQIGAEIHVAAQCVCRSRILLRYMTDIYSNREALVPTLETLAFPADVRPVSLRQTVAGHAEPAPPAGNAVRACASVVGCSAEGNTIRTTVSIRVLMQEENGKYSSARCRLPAEFTVSDLNGEMSLREVSVTVTDVYCGAGGADVRAVLQMEALAVAEQKIACVCSVEAGNVTAGEGERLPSIVLVRAPAGTDMWSLAKRYHSTVSAIAAANEGRQEGLLLIPIGR